MQRETRHKIFLSNEAKTVSKALHLSFIMKTLSTLASLCICTVSSATAATVYLNDAVIDEATNIPGLSSPPWSESGRVFTLTTSPNGFFVSQVTTVVPGTEFAFTHLSIAVWHGLFSVSAGEELTYLNAGSKASIGSFSPGTGNTLTIGAGQSAYIGYWCQRSGEPANSTKHDDDIFGWAKVTVSGGNLIVEESASARGGIIVGTTTVIPEPSSLLLLSTAALSLCYRRRHDH